MPHSDTVRSIMTQCVVTVDTSNKLREALEEMVRRDIGSIVVTREDRPYWIITERDITQRALSNLMSWREMKLSSESHPFAKL